MRDCWVLVDFGQVQERAANRLYYVSAKIVQSVSGSLLYLPIVIEFKYGRPSFCRAMRPHGVC